MSKDNSYPGREPGTPETKKFEYITYVASGVYWNLGVATLILESKTGPGDKKARQLRYALTVEQAMSVIEALQLSVDELQGRRGRA